jgi:putative ABC transport system ATP-binding protein
MNGLLQFERVSCRKGGNLILDEISLSAQKGEIVTVLGRSGSGKSTVLRLAIGLDEIAQGSVLFWGRDIREWNVAELRRRMGLVLQLPYLFPGTVADNLLYGPRIHRQKIDEDAVISEIFSLVGLPIDLAQRRTSDLSVGQQIRVSLGRTLANRPEILLLDEPTAALDPQSERHILNLIGALNRDGGYTIVCVTHKLESARYLGGRSILMDNGRIAMEGSAEEVLERMESRVAQAFLSEPGL